jgi:hypothetical protein
VDRFTEGRTVRSALRGVESVTPPLDRDVQARLERAVMRLLT